MPITTAPRITTLTFALLAAVTFAGCASPTDVAEAPETAALKQLDASSIASVGGTVYVLSRTTNQQSERVVTANITCDTLHTQIVTLDSITLFSDGRVLRVSRIEWSRNGEMFPSRGEQTGTWKTYTQAPYSSLKGTVGIALSLAQQRNGELLPVWFLPQTEPGTFSSRLAMGAMCSERTINARNDPARHEDAFYTRR